MSTPATTAPDSTLHTTPTVSTSPLLPIPYSIQEAVKPPRADSAPDSAVTAMFHTP